MATTINLGYPRIGARRELKRALEGYWQGALGAEELRQTAAAIRAATAAGTGADVATISCPSSAQPASAAPRR